MNEIVNKFLLAGDKFMPKMHLKHPTVLGKLGFIVLMDHLLKIKKIRKFKVTGYKIYLQK